MKDQSTFWFAAKRYGYGWSLPVRWQGWAVLFTYLALSIGGIYYLEPRRDALSVFIYFVVLTAALITIIAVKGERPLRWRWGKGDDEH